MDDKWLIYRQDDRIFFYRSWTGICIYEVAIVPCGRGIRLVSARVNRDPDQYDFHSDRNEADSLYEMIDGFFLGTRN